MWNKLHPLFLAGIAVFAAFFLVLGINAPWMHYRDSNGHLQERISRNYDRHGVLGLRLGPAAEVVSPELEPILKIKYENSFYFYRKGNAAYLLHHPPTLNLLLYASTRVFGIGPGALRLPMVLLVFATAALVYLMAARVFGPGAALAAVFFWALNPLVLSFGRMLDHVPFCAFFIALGTWQYLRWRDKPDARNLILLVVFLWAGGLASWYTYFLPPVLFLHHLLTRRDRMTVHLFFAVAAAVGGALGMLAGYYVWVVGVDGLKELLGAFAVRGGRALEINGTRIPIPFLNYLHLQLHRISFFFTPVAGLFVLGALWVWWRRPGTRVTKEQGEFLLLVLAPAVLILLTFRQGAYVHGFHIYFLSIFISVAAGWALWRMLRAGILCKAIAVCGIAGFLFMSSVYGFVMGHHLYFSSARSFAKLLDDISDEKTVVGQSLFDEPTMWWLDGNSNRMILPREITLDQVRMIINKLPEGYRFVHTVYSSHPDDANDERVNINAFMHRKFEHDLVSRKPPILHGAAIVYDGAARRKKPKLIKNLNLIPHAYFPNENLLFVSNGLPEEIQVGQLYELNNLYINRKPLNSDYTLFLRLAGSDYLFAGEPTYGMLPTGQWGKEIVSETIQIGLMRKVEPEKYNVQVALCSQELMRCMKPEVVDSRNEASGIEWTNIGTVKVVSGGDFEEIKMLGLLARDDMTLSELFVLNKLNEMKSFALDFHFDAGLFYTLIAIGDFESHKMRYSPDIMYGASRNFDQISLIEKMVPSAMQDFMAQQKFRLAKHYLKEKRYFRALREYYGIVLHVSNSYEYALRAFKYFSEKPWGGFFADRHARRLLHMRPGDDATREIVMAHYREAGRVKAGVKLLKETGE